jgi:AcrR family transcriptional regulator
MAARRRRPLRASPRSKSGDFETRLVEAALALAARQGWRRTMLGEIAAEAGVSLAELRGQLRSRGAILALCVRHFDRMVLAAKPDPKDSPKDRLFELLMRRFDALKSHRPALRAMCRDSIGDPAALLAGKRLLVSMGWMLEGAGIPTAGLPGQARRKVLLLVYLSVLVVFANDQTADLAKTMAALDRRLGLAAPFLGIG